eukprot:6478008-Amphidinium_carterae.1
MNGNGDGQDGLCVCNNVHNDLNGKLLLSIRRRRRRTFAGNLKHGNTTWMFGNEMQIWPEGSANTLCQNSADSSDVSKTGANALGRFSVQLMIHVTSSQRQSCTARIEGALYRKVLKGCLDMSARFIQLCSRLTSLKRLDFNGHVTD